MSEQKLTKEDKIRLIESIRSVSPKHCDSCGYKYKEDDFKLVKSQNQQATVHLRCQNCGNSYLLNIFSPSMGMIGSSRSQLNLDVTHPQELVKFVKAGSITMNEALDAYNLFIRRAASIEGIFRKKSLHHSQSTLIKQKSK
jgi:RNase P subunit RPR2